GGVAIAAALWWLAPWRAWRASTPPAPPAAPASGDTVRVSQASPSPVDTAPGHGVPVPAPTRASRRPSRERAPVPPPAAATESAARTVAAQRNDSLLRSLRARAA